MTTIVANTSQIAGDRQANHSGGLMFRMWGKVHKFNTPLLYPELFYVGLCGDTDSFADVISFLQNPTEHKKAPSLKNGEALVLSGDGKIWTFKNAGNWMRVAQDFYAIGSGSHLAMGAMAAGATPVEAVKHASKHDPNTGMGVTKFNI